MAGSQTDRRNSSPSADAPPDERRYVGAVRLPHQRFETDVVAWDAPGPARQRFVVMTDDGIDTVHEGPLVTLERVLQYETKTDPAKTGMSEVDPDTDLVVFDGLGQVRAIIRRTYLGDRVAVLDVPALLDADGEGEGRIDAPEPSPTDPPRLVVEQQRHVHRWGVPTNRPDRRYATTSADGEYLDVHLGPDLDHRDVIRWQLGEALNDGSLTFDRPIWDGETIVAIIRARPGELPRAIHVGDDQGDDD